MYLSTLTPAILLSLGHIAMAARSKVDIVNFYVYPQRSCIRGGKDWCAPDFWAPDKYSHDVDTESVKEAGVSCSNGSMCMIGICGRFLGKENMCCSSLDPRGINLIGSSTPPNKYNKQAVEVTVQEYVKLIREGCARWNSTLMDYDIEGKGIEPTSKDCKVLNWTDKFSIGNKYAPGEVVTDKSEGNHCCSVENDGISLYKDIYGDYLAKAVCIPALGRGKKISQSVVASTTAIETTPTSTGSSSDAAESAPTSTSSGASDFAKNATTTEGPVSKNSGDLGQPSSSLLILVTAGLAAAILMY